MTRSPGSTHERISDMKPQPPVHLGDGAYASVLDDHMVVITADHHDPLQASSAVYLGKHEVKALIKYLQEVLE